MSKVDQFESAFRSASKEVYEYQAPAIRSVLVVTDLEPDKTETFSQQLAKFLQVLGNDLHWQVISGEQFSSTEDLLELVGPKNPDLICTYRNLHSSAWQYPHSLGAHLDVLLQRTPAPVLILPHPQADYASEHALENTNAVMAITDHLASEHALVDYAAKFTENGGTLYLSHIEDHVVFERYIDAISKIDTIDTDNARERLQAQLLKEPTDYAASCAKALHENAKHLQVEALVSFGDSLEDYRNYIAQHQLDLLVMNSKDHDQLAMHGMAYPLAIELRQIPLLMI